MKRVGIALAIGLLVAITFQDSEAQNEKFHSIFIYNFSKYVKWPEAQNGKTFVIGVLGNSAIQKSLLEMAKTKKVNGMPIEIKQFNSASDAGDCHILYVSDEESGKIDKVFAGTQGKSVLIITAKPGLAQKGAAINFVEVDGKIKFELNQKSAEDRGLKVSGALAGLAILV